MRYIVILLVVLLILATWLYISATKRQKISDITIENLLNSLRIHDIERDSLRELRYQRLIQDSIAIVNKRTYIDKTPDIVSSIKKQYNDKRNHIDSLPVTEQLSFFASWISQKDTL